MQSALLSALCFSVGGKRAACAARAAFVPAELLRGVLCGTAGTAEQVLDEVLDVVLLSGKEGRRLSWVMTCPAKACYNELLTEAFLVTRARSSPGLTVQKNGRQSGSAVKRANQRTGPGRRKLLQ